MSSSTDKRATLLLRAGGGGQVYADSVREVNTGTGESCPACKAAGRPCPANERAARIVIGDGVEAADDWDRSKKPRVAVFDERGPRA